MTPDEVSTLCVFAVRRGSLENRLDVKYNSSQYINLIRQLKLQYGKNLKRLEELATVICGPFGSAIKSTDYCEIGIPLIRITNVSKVGILDYSEVVYISENLANRLCKTQVVPGDIVVSQRGSLGQCAIVDDKFKTLNISANIIAIKNICEISAEFLRYYICSSIGQRLIERNISGQVQQKITTSDIAKLSVPIPSLAKQRKLVMAMNTAFVKHNQGLKQAEEKLVSFYDAVSKQFNLNALFNNNFCFAIKLKQLDGVIDVKRYKTVKNDHQLTLGDVCDIVEQKVNASSFGTNTIDWIRIDDLPNLPLDIEQVRTQQGNEIEGSFFEVKENDILLARLGPTILNKKIVLVRKLQRQTIASSEFLVLRCRKGYNPEAVMAILKTDYYKNLMYSYARGSTPSRYRLNRDDALKLTFPNIAEEQNDLAQNAVALREQVKAIRDQAEQEWQEAKTQFEKELFTKESRV